MTAQGMTGDRVVATPATRRKAAGLQLSHLVPFAYLAPLLLAMGVFTFWPLIHTAVLSVQEWNLNPDTPTQFVGFDNYRGVVASSLFQAAAANTAIYILASIPLKVVLPIPVAIFLWSLGDRGRIWRTILFLPTLVSFVAVAVIWAWLLSPLGGYLQIAGQAIGIQIPGLLNREETAIWAILGISTWKVFGFNVLLYLAGLTRIERPLIEAMRMDGAGDGVVVRRLVLPLLTPSILLVLITTLIFTLQQVFTPIDMLTHGGPSNSTTNLFYMTYQYTFQTFNVGYASAATVLLFALVFIVAIVKFRLAERFVHYGD